MDIITDIAQSISQTIEPVFINDSPDGHTFLASSKGQEITNFNPHDILLKYLDDKNTNELFEMINEDKYNDDDDDDAAIEDDNDDNADDNNDDNTRVFAEFQPILNYHQLTHNIKFTDLTYNLENLEFNLQPNRGFVYGDTLREVVDTFGGNSHDTDFIEKVINILDTSCERQLDCAFLQYFYPHINKPGNICYSIGMESLITCAPQAIVSKIDYVTWISIVQNTFFPEIYEREFTPRTQELNICICCLLLQQAKIPIEAQTDSCILLREDSCGDYKNRIVHFINGEGESTIQYDIFSDCFNVNGQKTYKIQFPFNKYTINENVVEKIA